MTTPRACNTPECGEEATGDLCDGCRDNLLAPAEEAIDDPIGRALDNARDRHEEESLWQEFGQ